MPRPEDPDDSTGAYNRVKVGTYGDGSPVVVNRRTRAMLSAAEDKLGYPLTIVQGSYHKGTSQSAGTHDGGGVVDLLAYQADRKVRALRAVGFAAWHRTPDQGDWPEHVHAVALGDQEMSDAAREQVTDYRNGRNGLASHAPDPVAKPNPVPVFNFAKESKKKRPPNKRPDVVQGSPTPNRDAVEAAALKGLERADGPQLTRFFAAILEQVREGPDRPLRRKSAEFAAKPQADEDVSADGTAPAKKATAKKATAKKTAKKAAKRPR